MRWCSIYPHIDNHQQVNERLSVGGGHKTHLAGNPYNMTTARHIQYYTISHSYVYIKSQQFDGFFGFLWLYSVAYLGFQEGGNPLPSPPIPSPPLINRASLNPGKGSESAVSSPVGHGAEPQPKSTFGAFLPQNLTSAGNVLTILLRINRLQFALFKH